VVPIDKKFSIDFMFGVTTGTLNQLKYEDNFGSTTIKLDKDNLEGLARIDLSIGLNF